MSDLHQSITISTLSNICFNENIVIHNRLNQAIVIVIPCHYMHLDDKSIFHLLMALKSIDYIVEIVVVINGRDEYYQPSIDALNAVDQRITAICAPVGAVSGRGFALGFGFSYVYKKHETQAIIVTLDADLKNFTPVFLLKLIYPMTELAADFNKGYYTRYSDNKLDGRLTRILIAPLLHAFLRQEKNDGLLLFLLEFRYALSGDVAFKSHLIPKITTKSNWAYDLSLLAEIYKHQVGLTLVQTEITSKYEHAHRHLDTVSDYNLMVIADDIIHYLTGLYHINMDVLMADYRQIANNFVDKYERLALFNGLVFNRENEMQLVKQVITLLTKIGIQPRTRPMARAI